ncbi:winged helix-turn-helix transcriptional regulator [Streptomyces sp. NPDC055607]
MLNDRLTQLVAAGVVQKHRTAGWPSIVGYRLTPYGRKSSPGPVPVRGPAVSCTSPRHGVRTGSPPFPGPAPAPSRPSGRDAPRARAGEEQPSPPTRLRPVPPVRSAADPSRVAG